MVLMTHPKMGAFQRLAFAMKAALPMAGQMTLMSRKLWWFATMTNPLRPLGMFSSPSTLMVMRNSLNAMWVKKNWHTFVISSLCPRMYPL